jgi:hypothetical protein
MKHLYPTTSVKPLDGKNGLAAVTVKSFFLATCLLVTGILQAQYSAGNPGKFGIDGDIFSDARQQGTFAATGSHDWFYTKSGTGLGMFDTSDSSSIKALLSSGVNYSFNKRMQYAPYSIQNGQFFLDALYARDYIGNDGLLDKTNFTSGNKNSQDPSTWATKPSGDLISSKSDIIDAYFHLRRDGVSLTGGSPSNMILYLGASLMSNGGDHYLDFELFKNDIQYNTTTGKFGSTGPAATGGRNIWEFYADGSVKTFGEMTVSFSFSSSNVSDISIYIWVPKSTYTSIVPKNFTFTSDWNESTTNVNYGYAKISPKTSQTYSWASVSNAKTPAPAWGTTSKELGLQPSRYYSANYDAGQFAEAAIDFTLIGIDPALNISYDKCVPPYKRVMIKSRSSSSFASALQDFAGPFEFANAPVLSVNVAQPQNLTCTVNAVQLALDEAMPGVTYTWTTANGNIVSGAGSTSPVVDQPGQYIVTTSSILGCYPSSDTIYVYKDIVKPVAKIIIAGALTSRPIDSVTLMGGDTTASKYSNAYSSYQGLTYNWSSVDGFTGNEQNVKTNAASTYTLVVTQVSNGCTDTTSDVVFKQTLLPIKLKSFTGAMQNGIAKLEWIVEENQSGDHFILQSSTDGTHFKLVQSIPVTAAIGTVSYRITVPAATPASYYRLVLVNRNSLETMSKVVLLDSNNPASESLQIAQNPVVASVQFNYNTLDAGTYTFTIYNAAGMTIQQSKITCSKGSNRLSIILNGGVGAGNYILAVSGQSTQRITKFVKM